MTTFEAILATISSTSVVGNIVQFVTLRSTRKKANAEAAQLTDEVLLKRIDFLDERVSKLEKLACFDADCKLRK